MKLSIDVEFPRYVLPEVPFEVKIKINNNSSIPGKFWVNYSVDGQPIALLEEVPIGSGEEVLWADQFDIEWWTMYAPQKKYHMFRFFGGPMQKLDPLDNGPETMSTGSFKVTYGNAPKSDVPWGTIAAVASGVGVLGIIAKKGGK